MKNVNLLLPEKLLKQLFHHKEMVVKNIEELKYNDENLDSLIACIDFIEDEFERVKRLENKKN